MFKSLTEHCSRKIMVDINSSNYEYGDIHSKKDFKVTPWEVEGEVDYNKLIEKFGTQPITKEIIEKFKKITGEIHPMLKLRYFFSHRDFDWILNKYENGEEFYLYTGRGPSGMVHMGHLMPWIFTKYLQDKFGSKLLFQLTDDEKLLYSQDRTIEEIKQYTYENLLDIIAVGFDSKKTKVIIDTKHIHHLYPIATEIAKRITFSTAKAVFGFSNSTNIGLIGFPPIQAVPCFLPSIIEGKLTPVLIPAAIDQDPYWRMTRDVAERMGYYKPAQIHSKFLPGIGISGKMSSSKPETALFTSDEPETIEKKISAAYTAGLTTVQRDNLTYIYDVANVIENEVVIILKDGSCHSVILKDNNNAMRLRGVIAQIIEGKRTIYESSFEHFMAEIILEE